MLLGLSRNINILRLKELKNEHPNNSRIDQLGRRAAQCYLTLNNIGLDVSEELMSPDVKPGAQVQNQKIRDAYNLLVSDLVST